MRKIFILIALFAITASVNAQLKVHPNNLVTINAQTQDWWTALRVAVPTQFSCAYNLRSNAAGYNKDVFFVCADGYLWTLKGGYFGSDISLKENITPIEKALEKVKMLKGVRYSFKDGVAGESEDFRFGFIAQEVEEVLPEVVKNMPDRTKAMTYSDLIAVLVEAMKEQQDIVEVLQQKVLSLEEDLIDCCNKKTIEYESSNTIQQINHTKLEEMKVYQNTPNPFTDHTTIQCFIPSSIQKAELCIYNMQGTQVKCFTISERESVTVSIQAGQLTAGAYIYLLIGDSKASDSKQMILTK